MTSDEKNTVRKVMFSGSLKHFKEDLAVMRGVFGRDYIRSLPQGKLLDSLDAGFEDTSHDQSTWPAPDLSYRVWAIQYEQWDRAAQKVTTETVAVSAESEYGAVKRLAGNRHCIIKRVRLTDLEPRFEQRRIEGFARVQDIEWSEDETHWEYT